MGMTGSLDSLGPVASPAWLDVDLDAISRNVRRMRSWAGTAVEVMAVVKADGYGAGAVEVGRAALRGGASRLAVA